MNFIRVFPNQPLYSAAEGPFTFVITQDDDAFTASAKVQGAGTRIDLGGYCAHQTFKEAVAACEQFYRNRNG